MTRLLFAMAAVLCAALVPPAIAAENGPPNILLILADDVGFSDLGCYGGEISTPQLDALAQSGLRFSQCYNMARCCPSRASLLTGQYPHAVNFPLMHGALPNNCVTIAEALRGAGYRPYMAGKWHLGNPGPFLRGFDEYYGVFGGWASQWNPEEYVRRPAGREARPYAPGKFYATSAITDHALDFIGLARQAQAPWFLYLAYNAAHFPLQAPPEVVEKYVDRYRAGWDVMRAQRYERLVKLGVVKPEWKLAAAEPLPPNRVADEHGTSGKVTPAWATLDPARREDLARRMALYAAMIELLDTNLGRVVADLKAHGEFENTLIIFLSDNGACAEWDAFGFDQDTGPVNVLHTGDALAKMGGPGTFHSYGSAWANACNTPFRLFKHYCQEGGISTPLIMHWPRQIPESVRGAWCHEPAHVIDVLPTCLAAAGGKYPKAARNVATLPLVGVNLLPALKGAAIERQEPIFFEHEGNRAVRAGDWKLVSLKDGPWELYNMAHDRTEQHNLAGQEQATVERLAAAWNAWAKVNNVREKK